MADYQQNAPNIINRSVWPYHPRPLGVTVYGPGGRMPNMENPSRWTPYGLFQPQPYFFGWDNLHGQLMAVEQADTYDQSRNPFPNNGVWDEPNAWHGAMELLRLDPTGSAHHGKALPSGEASPTMFFQAPPSFSAQTVPIVAVGV